MRCANPDCRLMAHDLTSGSLRLLELEVSPEKRVIRSESGFPIVCVPSRYFWLCEQCSRLLRIRRWTEEGLLLECRMEERAARKDVREIGLPDQTAGSDPRLMIEKTA